MHLEFLGQSGLETPPTRTTKRLMLKTLHTRSLSQFILFLVRLQFGAPL